MEKFAPKLLFIFVITIFLDVVSPKSYPSARMDSQPVCEAPPYQKNSETDACSLEFLAAYHKFEERRKISDLEEQRESLEKQLDAIKKKIETRTRCLNEMESPHSARQADGCLNSAPTPQHPVRESKNVVSPYMW